MGNTTDKITEGIYWMALSIPVLSVCGVIAAALLTTVIGLLAPLLTIWLVHKLWLRR